MVSTSEYYRWMPLGTWAPIAHHSTQKKSAASAAPHQHLQKCQKAMDTVSKARGRPCRPACGTWHDGRPGCSCTRADYSTYPTVRWELHASLYRCGDCHFRHGERARRILLPEDSGPSKPYFLRQLVLQICECNTESRLASPVHDRIPACR